MDKNKVKFGLKNVRYAKLSISDSGIPSYGIPKPWPGAVSLGLDAEGDSNSFYADDSVYFTSIANNGYSGDFESALIPDEFSEDIMGNTRDENGVQLEDASVQPEAFALLFEFEGDKNAIRHVLYNCKMTRSSVESETTEDSVEPKTEKGKITASALVLPTPLTINGKTVESLVKAKTTADTMTATYQNWYNSVYLPTVAGATITSQPSGVSVASGGKATFAVTATGSGTLSYQWQKLNSGAWEDITGKTANSLVLDSVAVSDNGSQYRCIITNTQGEYSASVVSNAAVLTVTGG